MEVDQVAHVETDDTKVPFVEKYRPKSLEHIISHTEIVQTSKWVLEANPVQFGNSSRRRTCRTCSSTVRQARARPLA